MLKYAIVVILALQVAMPAIAHETDIAARERNRAIVNAAYEEKLRTCGDDPNMLILPGLVADSTGKTVRITCEATGMKKTDPAEFLVIAENSDHDYEAFAVSLAKPSDIHKALEFIGIKPGSPANADKLRFWPKGERVIITFEWDMPENGDADTPSERRRARAESLMMDKETGTTLPEDGFVFVGSAWLDDPDHPGKRFYAADRLGPNAIVSHYNDHETVLDVPRQAPQGQVYGRQVPSDAYTFTNAGQIIEVLLEPEYRDGRQRVADIRLKIAPAPGREDTASTIADVAFELIEGESTVLAGGNDLKDMLAVFERLASDGRDPFVTLDLDPRLKLKVAKDLSLFLRSIDRIGGIRIEPPPAGQLYYKSFSPGEALRDRANAVVHPWELRLMQDNDKITGTLTFVDDVLNEQTGEVTLQVTDYPASTLEEIGRVLEMKDKFDRPLGLIVAVVFAPADMEYRALMTYVGKVLETRPTVWVFAEE
ncbi:MAG: hypothetical protein E4H02_01140 [Lentisphaerales bacterium]|jgi:hypothetical protein|nr:MAG: hypothetical protein E4H02_01140 [Lentisphaerales bacterium]